METAHYNSSTERCWMALRANINDLARRYRLTPILA
jgi:hypothetical protein